MPPTPPSILELSRPNAAQAEAIAYDGDAVVTAGAGTGKTRTLVARYLALLERGVPLRRMVAITFTRKAAREMRNRVRQQIRGWLQGGADPARAAFWQQCYADLDAAYIGTIHGLCAAILRAHPAEAGVDPGFGELDEGLGGLLKARAVENALRWAADDARMFDLFRALSVEGLSRALSRLLGQRLDVAAAWDAADDPLPLWEAAVRERVARFWEDAEVRGALADLDELRQRGDIAGAEAQGDKLAPSLSRLLALRDRVEDAPSPPDCGAILDALAEMRAEMKGTVGSAKNYPAGLDPKAALTGLRARYDALVAPWSAKSAWALDLRAAALLPALRELFRQAEREHARLKEQRGALDYDDLEGMALALLEGHPAVAAAWQGRVDALLVDEFQDTNRRQRALVDLLARGAAPALWWATPSSPSTAFAAPT